MAHAKQALDHDGNALLQQQLARSFAVAPTHVAAVRSDPPRKHIATAKQFGLALPRIHTQRPQVLAH